MLILSFFIEIIWSRRLDNGDRIEAKVISLSSLGVWEESNRLKDGKSQKLLILSYFLQIFETGIRPRVEANVMSIVIKNRSLG